MTKKPKYNLVLDRAVEKATRRWRPFRREMFGGTCYIVRGNMLCGVYKDYLILRLGKEQAAKALKKKNTRPFDITGFPMKGWVMVDKIGIKSKALERWLMLAYDFVQTLPRKK